MSAAGSIYGPAVSIRLCTAQRGQKGRRDTQTPVTRKLDYSKAEEQKYTLENVQMCCEMLSLAVHVLNR